MIDAERITEKVRELYPRLDEHGTEVKTYYLGDRWLVKFSKEGHDVTFFLPDDFLTACVDQGFCYDYREECTQALGRLMKLIRTSGASADEVLKKLKGIVPELDDPEINIVLSEDDFSWTFFLTKTGVSRPVEYRLPKELIERCLADASCQELAMAAREGLRCLLGE